jgi:hypothetical protein
MTTGTKTTAAPGTATAERARRAARGGAAGGDRRVLARDPARAQEGKRIKPPRDSSVVDGTKPDTAADDPTKPHVELQEYGGSDEWPDFNQALVRATILSIPAAGGPDGKEVRIALAAAGLAAFKPKDAIEGMLAAQAVALHHAAMQCLGRAMVPEQHFEIASRLRKDGANMARAVVDMLDAMDRKRGRGVQVVRVERVVVHDGGQAIVGAVSAAAGVAGRGEGG